MTQCPSCKNMVQSGTTICPLCGSSISQISAPASPYSFDADILPYGEELPFIEHTTPASSTIPISPTAEPTIEQKTGFVTTAVPDATHLYYAKPVAAPLPHRARSIGTMALLGLLSLLLIVSTGGFSYYAAVVAPDDLHAQATSVAQTYLTAQAHSTEQASTQAIDKLLAMDPQALYSQVTSGTPIIDDPLTGPGGNTWFDYNDGDIGDCHFSNNAYHVRTSNAGDFFCEPIASFFKNMVFQVKVTIVKGDRGGFMFDGG
ncbi:MAG TPA: hypothetical protein VFU49_05495, partial [Ktedonobacteraceae bacterium]|nr:hypothetical protein [Ktedonobacteraceae bacterium]